MPEPTDKFAVHLSELEKVATQDLPAVSSALRSITNVIMAHEGLEGMGEFAPVYAMEGWYARLTDDIGKRQRLACDRIDATANALRDAVDMYRRADGQA